MKEPQDEGHLGIVGDLNYCNEAVFLRGETDGLASVYHEGNLASELNATISKAGGHITGDAALFL